MRVKLLEMSHDGETWREVGRYGLDDLINVNVPSGVLMRTRFADAEPPFSYVLKPSWVAERAKRLVDELREHDICADYADVEAALKDCVSEVARILHERAAARGWTPHSQAIKDLATEVVAKLLDPR